MMGEAARSTDDTRYERIGHGYARTRREDPRIAARVHAALGNARTVVNVGAGAGSDEPSDRYVIAIDPSDVMAAQRPPDRAPAIRASAGALPLRDDSIDAVMAMITIHQWDEEQQRGVQELRRVARGPVVVLTFDATVSTQMWLFADYLPEAAAGSQSGREKARALRRSRSHGTPLTGCSRRSGRIPSGCSTIRPALRRRASRGWTRRSSKGSSANSAVTSTTAPGTPATGSFELSTATTPVSAS